MKRRTLLAGSAALAAAPAIGRAAEKTKIVWWHAMTAALGDEVNQLADAFNASQDAVEMQALYKGGYADVLTATIAAFRAGQAPHLVQIFEVGTGSMLAAGKAVKQVWELAKETGVAIDPSSLHPGGARLLQPAGRAHGLDAVQLLDRGDVVQQGRVPQGRARSRQAARHLGRGDRRRRRRIKAKDAADVPMTTLVAELDPARAIQRAARHAVRQQGERLRGAGRELEINSKPHVKHMQRLLDMAKEGTFKYAGRDNAAGPAAGLRQGGHPLQLVRHARRHGEKRQIRLGRGVPAVRSGR